MAVFLVTCFAVKKYSMLYMCTHYIISNYINYIHVQADEKHQQKHIGKEMWGMGELPRVSGDVTF